MRANGARAGWPWSCGISSTWTGLGRHTDPPSRQGTRWLNALKTRVVDRLIDPGSEWRLHRHGYRHSALGDRLGEDEGVAQSDTLYRCLDKLLAHKKPFFSYLRARWQNLFGTRFEVLLYDLTRPSFESDPPGYGNRPFGYSRDKRFDCVQGVIALIVTPEGFPPPRLRGHGGPHRRQVYAARFLGSDRRTVG